MGFNEQLDDFMGRPLWQRIAAWVGSLLLIGFIWYQYMFSPNLKAMEEVSLKYEELNKKIADETRRARNLDKLRAKVKDLDIKLKFILQELPNEQEIPSLLSEISNLAKDAGLDVSLFKPTGEGQRDFYAEVPVAISVEGSYHQVATFFDEVSKLDRIVNINQIQIRDPQISDEIVKVKTDCVATTFRYLTDAERNAGTAQASGDGKKRRR